MSTRSSELAIVERDPRYENDRILRRLRTAGTSSPYRFIDFRCAEARHDLIAMHQFLGRSPAATARGAVRDLVSDPKLLRPFILPGSPTLEAYLADLELLAEALRRG